MSRPLKIVISSALAAWDTDLNDNLDTQFDDPYPLAEFATEGALPDANQFDRCVAAVNNPQTGYTVYLSDGTNWIPIGRQSVSVADLAQNISPTYVEAEVQAISDKVDELLVALRAFVMNQRDVVGKNRSVVPAGYSGRVG